MNLGEKFEIITQSEHSDWVCYLSGDPSRLKGSVKFVPRKDFEPNWFHRKMQELFFGVKWVKK